MTLKLKSAQNVHLSEFKPVLKHSNIFYTLIAVHIPLGVVQPLSFGQFSHSSSSEIHPTTMKSKLDKYIKKLEYEEIWI